MKLKKPQRAHLKKLQQGHIGYVSPSRDEQPWFFPHKKLFIITLALYFTAALIALLLFGKV